MTIPFVWKLQPFLHPDEWCKCKRCKRALFNLRSHVGALRRVDEARSQQALNALWTLMIEKYPWA